MENTIRRLEVAGDVHGVPGRFLNVVTWPKIGVSERIRGLISNQRWVSTRRSISPSESLQVTLRYDDECGNGHESFSITGDIVEGGRLTGGGCVHDLIAEYFPELSPLIKWHLCSSDGPMHYIGNTVYFAGDRDHNGLLKGEARQIVNGKTGEPCWRLEVVGGRSLHSLGGIVDGETCPVDVPVLEWRPVCRIGEGKARQLDLARDAAVWPDAPDSVLMLPKEELTGCLTLRLPALIDEFKSAMVAAGFLLEA